MNIGDALLNLQPSHRGLISFICNKRQGIRQAPLDNIKIAWDQDLNLSLSEEIWDTIFKLINSTSLCAHHSLLQFKVVHRTHISKTKLSRFHPDVDPCCNKYKREEASLIHIFWTCPSLEKYWREAFQTLSLIVNLDIEPKPLVTLFGNTGEVNGHLRPAKWPTLSFASLLARCAMLLMWRDAALPTHAQWLRDVMTCLNLEKIHYSIRNSKEKFQKSVGTFSGILS